MKRIISLAVASALTLACFTGCTIHLKLKDKDTTSSYNYDYDYDYDYDYSNPLDDYDVSSSYGEKMTLTDADMKDSTEDAPLNMGEWGKAMCYTVSDPEYSYLGVTPTELIRGDAAKQMLIDAGYNSTELDSKLANGDEWAILRYKVYCPDSFPANSLLGCNYTYLSVQPRYYTTQYEITCVGLDISNYDIDDYKANYIFNGEAGEGLYAFMIAKTVSQAYIRFGSDPDYSNNIEEGYAYFLVK